MVGPTETCCIQRWVSALGAVLCRCRLDIIVFVEMYAISFMFDVVLYQFGGYGDPLVWIMRL